jgi:hypothetical protein
MGTLEENVGDDDARRVVAEIAPADSKPSERDVLDVPAHRDSLRDSLELEKQSDAVRPAAAASAAAAASDATFELSLDPAHPSRPLPRGSPRARARDGQDPSERAAAFAAYQNGEGASLRAILFENKTALRDRRLQSKTLGLRVNAVKKKLDAASARRAALAQNRPPIPPMDVSSILREITEVLTEEEHDCAVEIRELKREYRELFETLKRIKSEAAYTEKLVERCATTVALEFESWYRREYRDGSYDQSTRASDLSTASLAPSAVSSPSRPTEPIRETHPGLSPDISAEPRALDPPGASASKLAAYDSEASSAAYYSAQSARAGGGRRGETPQARRIAAQSARPFAPKRS